MFRLAGYDKMDFSPVDITKPVNIQLKASIQSLNEVEVIGYGHSKKERYDRLCVLYSTGGYVFKKYGWRLS